MFFIVKNNCFLSTVDKKIINYIKQKCTLPNPLFNKKLEMNLSVFGVPQYKTYYEINNKGIIFPIGILPELVKELIENFNILLTNNQIIDQRTEACDSHFFSTLKFTGTLRDYQKEVVNICMTKTIGNIEAMTGSGKTIAFINFILERKQNCIILVNTLELANQIIESFEKVTNLKKEDIGFIGNGQFNLKQINVALHQTMYRLDDEKYNLINKHIGLVIADEVHIIAADTYYSVMSKLNAKYKFGFSATMEREDGLTEVIKFATGPIIHKVPEQKLENVLIKPKVLYIKTNYFFPLLDSSEYNIMLNDLAENEERNKLIYYIWKNNYFNNYTIMLCHRLSQVNKLKELIGEYAEILTSKMKKNERKEVMEKLKNKEKKVIISTYGLFSTGIDLPHFDVLFFCSPLKSKIKVKQSAGRLMRKAENKESATIVDFVDVNVSLLKNHFYKRKKILENLWLK